MDEIVAPVRRWGGSLGVVIPSSLARAHRLKPGDRVKLRIERDGTTLRDLQGFLRGGLKGVDWDWVERELSTGWGDD